MERNITDHLYNFARSNPEKAALLHPVKITFSGLCSIIDKYAVGFLDKGIQKGTKTIVLITPGTDLFAVSFALLRIGAIPVMIDPGMGVRAMVKALSTVRASAFIGIPSTQFLRFLFPRSFQSVSIFLSSGRVGPWSRNSLNCLRKGTITEYQVANSLADEEAAIFFTSGSTGMAKAVVYENSMLEAQIHYLKAHFGYRPEDIDLCTFPLIGLLVITLGLTLVLADMNMTYPSTMDPRKVAENIVRYNCSTMFCSPMVLKKLAEYGEANEIVFHSLRKVFTAGAPVSPVLLKNFRTLLTSAADIHTPFGSTEALSVTDINDRDLSKLYGGSYTFFDGICVGSPLKDIKLLIIRITDDPVESIGQAGVLQSGEVGEIVVKGPNVTQSYFGNDTANTFAKIRDSDSKLMWHRTGDLGRLDKEGRVWFYGRKLQRVVANDRTYFTIPCEAVFNQHPKVQRSALVGVKKKGSVLPVICVELKNGINHSTKLKEELLLLGQMHEVTNSFREILFFRIFPVDPRHQAKIHRERLAVLAQKQLS